VVRYDEKVREGLVRFKDMQGEFVEKRKLY